MIDKDDLLKSSDFQNVYQAEKDYLQHLVLSRLYANAGELLVFKGGTALQKIYGLNRFSEDLDFTFTGADLEKGANKIKDSIQSIERFYDTQYKIEKDERSMSLSLKIQGPLYKKPASLQTIIIEISFREKVIDAPKSTLITPRYPDMSPYFARVMSLDEILAEKTRAIITRRRLRSRDLYDTYFILHKGGQFNLQTVNSKLKYYNIRFSKKQFHKRVGEMKEVWDKELSLLMKEVPDYDTIADYVIEKIADNNI